MAGGGTRSSLRFHSSMILFLLHPQAFQKRLCSGSPVSVQIPGLGIASWTHRTEEMGASPAVLRSEWASLGPPAAAPWAVPGATPASSVLRPTPVSGEKLGMNTGWEGGKRGRDTSRWILNSDWRRRVQDLLLHAGQGRGAVGWGRECGITPFQGGQAVGWLRLLGRRWGSSCSV